MRPRLARARASRWSRRRSYTLVELVVSMAAVSIVLGAIGSTVLVTTRALPAGRSPNAGVIDAGGVLASVAGELGYALEVKDASPAAVEFTVADRNADTLEESIRYEWSGTPGDPLVRYYNGGAAVEMLPNVQDFALEYLTTARTVSELPAPVEGGETLLSAYEAGAQTDFSIDDANWIGHYIAPSFASGTVSWKVTRVQINIRRSAPDNGETRVQLRAAAADGTPTGTVLNEAPLLESNLTTSYAWYEFPLATAEALAPGDGVCLVVKHIANAVSARVCWTTSGVAQSNALCVQTANGGVSWTTTSSAAMWYRVYGVATTQGAPTSVAKQRLDQVRLRVTAGDGGMREAAASVLVLTDPEVTLP